MARELDDAILHMRTNELEIGTWMLKTEGDAAPVLAADAVLEANRDHWFVRETIGMLRRTLARLDVSSRSLFALIEPAPASPARWPNWPSAPTAPTCWTPDERPKPARSR
jgi:hypothetical protein